jgi:ribosomal protein S18 acetylase RimI-like enzyme
VSELVEGNNGVIPSAPVPGVAIRPAHPDEFEAVGALTADAYLTDDPVGDNYLEELRDAAARAAAGELLVAVRDGTRELLATVSLFTWEAGPRWAEGATDGDAVMRMLAVAPGARRMGLGRALTLECVRRARAAGCRRLVLLTVDRMSAARALYAGLGFRRDPVADVEPVPGVRLLGYWLPLAG